MSFFTRHNAGGLTSCPLTGGLSVPLQIPLSGTTRHYLLGTLSVCIEKNMGTSWKWLSGLSLWGLPWRDDTGIWDYFWDNIMS